MPTFEAELYVQPIYKSQKLTAFNIIQVVEDCTKGNENAMKKFYEHFHGYALSVCLAYATNREDALEIMNDGFLKIFNRIHTLQPTTAKQWIRKIMVNGAIDHYRKNLHKKSTELTENFKEENFGDDSVFAKLSSEEILLAIQELPTTYRMVFNLYVIEGYSHKEIGEKLQIAESTSRANLSVANQILRTKLRKYFD